MTSLVSIKLKPRLIKYVDLFCGIGGFRQAIETLGQGAIHRRKYQFQCVLSCDLKVEALQIYNLNFRENCQPVDIKNLDLDKIEPFDLLCAGFPCQPFSTAGSRQGFLDPRGNLIYNVINLCQKFRPQTLILENVPNLAKIDNGQTLETILNEFTQLGYHMDYRLINAQDHGVPQDRLRLFIVGSLNSPIDLDQILPSPTKVLRDVINVSQTQTDIPMDLYNRLIHLNQTRPIEGCGLIDKRGGVGNINSWDLDLNGTLDADQKDLMRKIMTERRRKHWAKSKGITWMDGMPLTLAEIETFFTHDDLKSILDDLVAKNYLKLEKPKDLVNGKRVYKDDAELGYNICKGKLSYPITQILDRDQVVPTLTATDSCKLVVFLGSCIRYLTKDELKLLCGFPPDFQITDDVDYYDLFGNTICPPVVESILRLIYA